MDLSSLRILDSNCFLDKLKSFLSYRFLFFLFFHKWIVNIDNFYFQANHISLTPGKKHSVKVFGSHITTNRNPSMWKFEGRLQIESACSNIPRPFANGNPVSINKGLSICMGGGFTQFPLKVM